MEIDFLKYKNKLNCKKMLIVEFLGAPYSGKTYIRNDIEKHLLKSDKKFYTYKKFLLSHYSKIDNNFFHKFIFLFLNYKYKDDIKKNKKLNKNKPQYKNHLLRKYLNNRVKFIKFELFKSFKKNNTKFVKLILNFLNKIKINHNREHDLMRWFIDITISYELYKKIKIKNSLILDCEGFTHRLSSFMNKKYDESFINKYLKFAPVPDVLIYINENSSNCKKRIIKDNVTEDVKKYSGSVQKSSLISKKIFKKIKNRCPNVFVINSRSYNASVRKKILKSILIKN